MKKRLAIRWILFILGIIILTFGARLILLSNLGVGGLDAIAIGLAKRFGYSIGGVIVLLGIALIIIGGLLIRHLSILPIGTSLLVGHLYNIWGSVLFDKVQSPTVTEHIGYTFLAGILIAPFGAAIYILSQISMGPVDYLMMAIRQRFDISMQAGRILIETSFVIIGLLVGGSIGIGTVCIMLFWGPILQVYYQFLERHLKKYLFKKKI